MPHIEIKLYPGYGEEKRKRLAQSVLEAVVHDLEVPERVVSITFEEVSPEQWQEKVYAPLIENREGLVKAPDYQ